MFAAVAVAVVATAPGPPDSACCVASSASVADLVSTASLAARVASTAVAGSGETAPRYSAQLHPGCCLALDDWQVVSLLQQARHRVIPLEPARGPVPHDFSATGSQEQLGSSEPRPVEGWDRGAVAVLSRTSPTLAG